MKIIMRALKLIVKSVKSVTFYNIVHHWVSYIIVFITNEKLFADLDLSKNFRYFNKIVFSMY